ncbi:ABC transporter substrate-binding protein [Desulfoluna sp.]|uniref:ABC transporter substrate-binding protein n=1 Tax=Desulfoluna sp. TaxID=2045199 RepID=UPI002601A802|nr:ABC transporter substrate-binding protein [Desulfoluna sp.]
MKKSLPGVTPRICALLILLLLGITGHAAHAAPPTLRIALLPIPDVLPVFVAQEKGYFADAGIRVETLSVGSALERDQLMQAGRIDAMVNEMAGTASFNRNTVRMKIVAVARAPKGASPLFRILSSPTSGITTPDQLKGVPIAVSKNTVIEYLTDRLLQEKGFSKREIVKKSVPVLPERMQLLLSGQIKAATLPDPLAFAAMKAGAHVVLDDTHAPFYSASVLSFSAETLAANEPAVKAFISAWMKAAADLNADPESFRPLMLKKIRVPKNVHQSFSIPPFPIDTVPTRAQWEDTMAWMVDKGLLKAPLSYEPSVVPSGTRE